MQPNPQPLALWGALGTSQAIITGSSFLVESPASNPATAPFLVLPALVVAGTSLVLPHLLKGPPLTTQIIRWSLAEAATLFGFVSYFLSGQHLFQFVCVAMGFAAWAAAIPASADASRSSQH